MLRALALALALALLAVAPAGAQIKGSGLGAGPLGGARAPIGLGNIPSLPVPPCSRTQRVLVTATGAGSVVAPPTVCTVDAEAWGGGGSPTGTGNAHGGAGGGYGNTSGLAISPGATVFYSVGVAAASSWVNITTNASPTSSANGVVATGGSISPGQGTVFGTKEFSGGALGSFNLAGGGGAGSGGAGGNPTSNTVGGIGGIDDGNGGGAGGAGAGFLNSIPCNVPAAPGGGAAGDGGTCTSNAGANGQIRYTFHY